MLKDKVIELLDRAFEEREDLFLIDFSITPDNKIRVIIDGDTGVSLNDCIFVSRQVEHNLDREEEDFSLEVSSPGATEPLQHQRQYLKNIGRTLKVSTAEGEFEGKLVSSDASGLKLEWKAREPKPVGKGKHTVLKEKEVSYGDIVEAKVVITF
ncbi:ribosome assembly cofactor RimP [Robertkochia solimangrovi]|uniref:ribosome assembly cofactor RimP n=1 Tax=Robertkochia solimangrovi TaxID=2213046 RepID=UPI00117EB5F1|nr:ribosome assembly cofactor RimP [Robertkochia solimangrovi]TRZ46383.1 ribosome assembly cofactor RimP [Robertkochia solimangrovi]